MVRKGVTFGRMTPRTLLLAAALLAGGCTPNRQPPPERAFGGLPIAGDMEAAQRAGFRRCFNMDAINVRCRRAGVMLYGHGPYQAAIDLRGSKGQSGFDHLTLWHDTDQDALYQVLLSLHRNGWRSCHTGSDHAGDQAIFTHPSVPIRISMDISYYGERRLRIFPSWKPQKMSSRCVPNEGLGMFNLDA
jgi:hypothetical protein